MSDKTNLFLIIFILIVLGGSYYWYSQLRTTHESSEFSTTGVVGQEFLELLVRVTKTELETGFFAEAEFKDLKDLTPAIEMPQVAGKNNPFSPLVPFSP